MKITRRSLFGILAGAAVAPIIPVPSTPIEDVRRAMRAMGSRGLKVNTIHVLPSTKAILGPQFFADIAALGLTIKHSRD